MVSDMTSNPSQEAQEGGGDDEWEVISVTGSQAHPDPDPEVDTKTGEWITSWYVAFYSQAA